jgi:hypothetical protein
MWEGVGCRGWGVGERIKGRLLGELRAIFPAANTPRVGTLSLLAHADGSPSLFAYGSIVDNASGDPVFFGGR